MERFADQPHPMVSRASVGEDSKEIAVWIVVLDSANVVLSRIRRRREYGSLASYIAVELRGEC